MILRIPHQDHKRLQFFQEIVDVCLASRSRRVEQYATWRNYFFYGTTDGESPSPYNLLYSHLDTLTSFLYASDSTRFSVKMGSHAPRSDYRRTQAFAKRIMEEWKTSNADIVVGMAVLWALVYDSTFLKLIRRRGHVYPFVVDPACFGVYRDDVPMLDRQEAFVHTYYMTKTDLEKRIALHPNRHDILRKVSDTHAKDDTAASTPPIVNRVVMTSGQPGVGMDSLIGEANVNIGGTADYTAQLAVPVIEMQEIYVWNDDEDDYQVCTMASSTVVVFDRPNIFMPRTGEFEGEHGFVQICPNPLPDYFYGQSEVSKLYTIQEKLNDRMADIERLEQKQVDPPSAWGGMGLAEDKLDAFNEPGANIAIGDANYKREVFIPTIPEHVYSSLDRFQAQMDVVSGLPNVVQGKGESGVRSAGHAGKLLTVGTARPKKRALIIEDSLEKAATLYGICIYVDETDELIDEKGEVFIPAQMSSHFTVEVDAHSNSPVFAEDSKAVAAGLFKAKAITRQRLIQLTNPPMQEELIRDLEEKIIPEEAAAAKVKMQMESQKGGKPPLASVK